jgi:hypothetical protein
MAEYKPQAVKDVPAQAFIHAYAAHLKSTDKVSTSLKKSLTSVTQLHGGGQQSNRYAAGAVPNSSELAE